MVMCLLDDVIFITHQRSCRKVMFLVVSVCLSVHRGKGGPHVYITHDALDLILQSPALSPPPPPSPPDSPSPPPPPQALPPSDMGLPWFKPPHPLLVKSGGRNWRPVQTCSLDLTVLSPTPICNDIWWPLKHVQLASEQYTFYRGCFLFIILSH